MWRIGQGNVHKRLARISAAKVGSALKIQHRAAVGGRGRAVAGWRRDRSGVFSFRILVSVILVGKQALELEFLKGALRDAPRPRSASTSVITGPAGCRSREDVG